VSVIEDTGEPVTADSSAAPEPPAPPTESFETFFDRVLPRAVSTARRLLDDRTSAEDAAVEALARAYADWERLAHLPHRDAWALRVTANVAYDQLRRQARRRPLESLPDTSFDAIDTATLRATVVPALKRLSKRQREVVVLVHIGGLTQEEVADVLGCSLGSVKTHSSRALARLRRDLTSGAPARPSIKEST
jgi:RNA polymerase sigma-70 factor (sigma-E family)